MSHSGIVENKQLQGAGVGDLRGKNPIKEKVNCQALGGQKSFLETSGKPSWLCGRGRAIRSGQLEKQIETCSH